MAKNITGNNKNKNVAARSRRVASAPASLRPDIVGAFIVKHAFQIFLGLLLLIALIVFKDFIFLRKLFLYKDIGSDTLNGSYPLLRHTADYIHTTGLPKWSFNFGMGQNIFPFFLRDPFDIILYIIGKDNLAYGIGYVELIKLIGGGMLFFLYLRMLSLNPFTCIVGSLLFSFSGFMILGGGWYQFSFEAIVAVSLLLSFEKLFQQNSWALFPIVIAVIGLSMPFNLYVFGLFIAIYAVFRFIDKDGWNFKAFALLFSKLALLGILGAGISSYFMFGNILALIESPRGSGNTSYSGILSSAPVLSFGDASQNVTAIMRFFSSDMMGTGINFKGWQNYLEAPMFYTGLLSLLLFPAVFQFLDKRRKIIYGAFLGLWILPVMFPYFRYAFWLFTGDYYRAFSFFVSFALLYLGLQALNNIIETAKIKPLVLVITLVALLGILSYDYSGSLNMDTNAFNKDILFFARIVLVIYAVLIYMLSRRELQSIAKILLLLTLCIELGYFSSITVNKRSIVTAQEFKSKEGYNDYSTDAVSYLKDHDKSFYRVDKNYSSGPAIHASINDGMAQDYRGTSSYHSFNNNYYVSFLQAIGVARKGDELGSRWAAGLATKPIEESIGNVKYFLAKQPYNTFIFDSIAQFGDVKVVKNKFYLPPGFTYDKYVLHSDFDSMPPLQRDFAMMKGFLINNEDKAYYSGLDAITLKDTVANYTFDIYANDRQALMKDTLSISDFSQNSIKGKINLDKKKLLFLSIPYDKGWTATVDGQKQELKVVDAGMMGLLLDKGNHLIEMQFYPRLLNAGLVVSIVSLLLYGIVIWWSGSKKKKLI